MPIRRWTTIFLAVLLLGMLVACGENAANDNVGEFKGVPDVAVGGSGGSGNDITVDSAEGAVFKFAQETLAASTGKIKVTFNSKSTPGILHNWVLVKPGNEDAAVTESVAPAYVPTGSSIAHTKTIDGGQSDSIEFEVAEAGTYTYLCTFPGHYVSGMKGTMTVAAGGETAGGGETASGGAELVSNSAEGAVFKFAEESLTAPAGEIKVTFNSKSTPGILHNWVLVKPGDEDKAVQEATANAPAYVPTTTFVGYTKTIDSGQSDTVSFTVEPGTYSFICTFPGHYVSGMKGTLTVE